MRLDVLFESVERAAVPVSVVSILKHLAAAGRRIASTGPRVLPIVPVVTTIVVAVMILGGAPGWSQTGPPSPQLQRLSPQEAARFQQIITGVIQNPNYLTPSVHGEFWRILRKMGASPAEVKAVRERMTGMLTVYYPLFWQDALTSLRNRRPYKSPQRQQYEKKLLAQRLITRSMVNSNDAMMANIASGNPIVVQGKSIPLNQQAIEASLRNLQVTVARVDRLFTPGPR